MGCTEITEHKGRNSSCRNVGSSLYLLIMMMDDSTMFQEEHNQKNIMGRLENEFCLTCLPHGESVLLRKCLAEQTLGNWLKTFSTHLEIYSSDVDPIMEAKVKRLKHLGNVPFKGSREGKSIERNQCWTLLMKFVIIGKTTTSNEKTVIGNTLLCYRNLWKTTLLSAN